MVSNNNAVSNNDEQHSYRDIEKLITTVNKDLKKLFLSGVVAIISGMIANMLIKVS